MRNRRKKYSKRRSLLLLVIIICVIWAIFILRIDKKTQGPQSTLNPMVLIPTIANTIQTLPNKPYRAPKASLFVPYWKLSQLETSLTSLPASATLPHQKPQFLIYFGIAPDSSGSIQAEPGLNNIQTFSQLAQNQTTYQTLLTVRMMDESTTIALLDNPTVQQELIKKTIELAKTYHFDGIVLDLEHSVLPTEKVKNDITSFAQRMQQAAKSESLIFAMTLYGDVLYRQRPYDIEALGKIADYVLIMGYDFHKSYGEPGPNFPAKKGASYTYDLETLASNFTSVIRPQKIIYIFGLYGYEWTVDNQNRPLKSAKALTLSQIQTLKRTCPNCAIHQPDSSGETHITWEDPQEQERNNQNSHLQHILWFEDESSIAIKYQLLRNYDINQVGYWAAGYY